MENITQIVLYYIALWGPALTAIGSIIATLFLICRRANEVLTTLKDNKTFQEIRDAIAQEREEMAQERDRWAEERAYLSMITRSQKLLIDRITKIEGYWDALMKEEAEKNGENNTNTPN